MMQGRRRDTGSTLVTERDLLALCWMGEQYCILFDQLQLLLSLYAQTRHKHEATPLQVPATYKVMRRWLELGYIDPPRRFLAGQSPCLWLSREGLAELELPYPYNPPRLGSIKHRYAVNAVRLHMQRRRFTQQVQWVSQRTLALEAEGHPLPDAELQYRGLRQFIAIQVMEKEPPLLSGEITRLTALANRYTQIWYFLAPEALEPMREIGDACGSAITRRLVTHTLNMQEGSHEPQIVPRPFS
jgi:hypothetical protein